MKCQFFYTSIDLFNMDVMVAELSCYPCFFHTLTNMRQLGLNSSGQMSGVWFGVNVGLESPAGD